MQNTRIHPLCLLLFFVVLIGNSICTADVKLPKVVSSNMVLQQKSEVKVWGWADAGEPIRVACSWLDKITKTQADDKGHWSVMLKTRAAGGPHKIIIAGKNTVTLNDILFGEVWLASGQSNMEMPLIKVSGAYTGIKDFENEVSQANFPEIRLFQAGNFSSKEPLDDVESGIKMYGVPPAACQWQKCSPETVPTFASTAYFFAREIHRRLNVPVGIIDASWGGTPAEAWTPLDGLKQLNYTNEAKQATDLPQKADQKIPSRLYNGMIHPLRNVKIKGAIWYQGEGNSRRADKYHELFSTMITQWRSVFGHEFPFYFVQISPFNYRGLNSAFLREAQLKSLSLPRTGMAVTMDIGNLTDIHPKNKQEVGRRLALWALAKDYGHDVAFSGPLYRRSQIKDGKVIVEFDHATELSTRDGKAPSDFEISGTDGEFHAAKAVIEGSTVIVSSEKVKEPQSVRYAFSNQAMPNLTNKAGLPASSFRTSK
ncbi:MAG: sialate O-acetylesterase [Planctomycetaceae bacterium]|nr:sialate O-acetylesterase [Planctomycetaceae bacterium]